MKPPLEKPLPVSSSRPPAFAADQLAFYREVMELLNREQIAYAVSGAFAFHHHTGIWRDTKDLDLFLPAATASQALAALAAAGFEHEISDPVWLAKVHRGDYFVDLISGMSNAVLRVEPSWIARAQPCRLFDADTRVLAAEELLASKLFVLFRERFDGADMVHILYRTRGRLDWQRVLELVGEHRDLLYAMLVLFHYVYPQAAETVPRGVWKMLAGELAQALEAPRSQPGFRGSLLDENMFAVDVKDWGLPDALGESRSRPLELIRDLRNAA